MFHRLLIGLTCLAAMAGSASAQSTKNNKLVRVTYPVADLVVPIPNYSKPGRDKERELTKEALAEQLKEMIMQSIAPRTWESNGGRGSIQYFPFGMAIVVEQRADVQEQIAKLLEDLRRLQDVQISVETRFVLCSERCAKLIWQRLEKHGEDVRVHQANSSLNKIGQARPMRSVDDKQLRAILEDVQADRSAHIMQAPKITMFNGQKVVLSGAMLNAKRELWDGFLCDLLSVFDPHSKAVRLSMDMELAGKFIGRPRQNAKASATVNIPPERTLVWYLGTPVEDRHLFVAMTPRMVNAAEEQRIFAGERNLRPSLPPLPPLRGEAEEQAVPEQKKPDPKAIEKRLRQPISLNFKDVPLQQAIKDLSLISDVTIVPDVKALGEARVNLDSPISIVVDNVELQQAIKLMFKPLGLRYVIANDAIQITVPDIGSRSQSVIYKIGDILDAGDKRATGAAIITLIEDTVARDSWENRGGNGTIQFLPREKTLTVRNQPQEVQEEIAMLLESLRRLYDLSVEVDARVVQMSADAAKRWRTAMKERDDPLLAAMRLLESGDRPTTITRPTLRTLNGQQAVVEIGDQTNGYKLEVLPVVTPDRRSVRLTISIGYRSKDEARSVEHVMKATKTFEMPDGRTQVWDVGAVAGGDHLFLFVSPRVIDRSRQEERLFIGEIDPIPGR